MSARSPKPRISSDVSVGDGGRLNLSDLRHFAQTEPAKFDKLTKELSESGDLTVRRLNLKQVHDALAPVEVPASVQVGSEQRDVKTSAFPLFVGNLMVADLNAAYEAVPTVGQELVTDMETNKKETVVAGVLALAEKNLEVEEGDPFPTLKATQERFDIIQKRKGARLQITQELLEEADAANQLADRINFLGELMAEEIEKQTLEMVCDLDGSAGSAAEPYVLKLNKSNVSLYETSNTNQSRLHSSGNRVTNNALVDVSDLDAARTRLAGMTNSRGERLPIRYDELVLLVPDALLGVATSIRNSDLEPGNLQSVNNWGPQGPWRPKIVSTPKLDDISATAWYLGNFKRQFRRAWKIRMETVTLADPAAYARARIAFEARVAWSVGVGAVDQGVYVVQSLTATTAPSR